MSWHGALGFLVELSQFSVSDLPAPPDGQPLETLLKVNFDEQKEIRSQIEHKRPNQITEYSIKESFHYRSRMTEKSRLSKKNMTIEVLACPSNEVIGSCEIDLYTLACGASHYELTLINKSNKDEACGVVSFDCEMQMRSEIKMVLSRLRCDSAAFPSGCKMTVFSSIDESVEIKIPFAADANWMEKSYDMKLETHLSRVLTPGDGDEEFMGFILHDSSGAAVGDARLFYRPNFALDGRPVEFKVPVRLARGDSSVRPTLSGSITYENLPSYAQMAEAVGVDNKKIHGGFLLYPGLPFPDFFDKAPPSLPVSAPKETWQNVAKSAPSAPTLAQDNTRVSYQVPLPPHWQRRFDRNTNLPYYADSRVKMTCWIDPRYLPAGWDQRIDPGTGKIYFADHKTRKTTFTDPRGCPPGWEMRLTTDETPRPYYAYSPTRQTSYTDPRGCPPGVTPVLDPSGKLYFRHHASRSTSWDDPRTGQMPEVLNMWRMQELQAWREAEIMRIEEDANRQRHAE